MAIKRRGLGRNLDALLGGARSVVEQSATAANIDSPIAESSHPTTQSSDHVVSLAIDAIEPGHYQPRKAFADTTLQELADSIKQQGVISPITVRQTDRANTYELIAGERRWRAAQLAGLHAIPALVKQISDKDALAIALIENIQREDLNPMEEANALRRLLTEFDLTHQEIADVVGKSRSAVSNLLRLTELHPAVKQLVEQGELEMGHARALLALDGGSEQVDAGKRVVTNNLSVRETERLVKQILAPKQVQKRESNQLVEQVKHLLTDKLVASVKVQHSNATGKGKIVITYHSVEELAGIVERINQ